MVFTTEMPPLSVQYTVFPSFDGTNVLPTPDDTGFTFIFQAAAPNLTEVAFDANGKLQGNNYDRKQSMANNKVVNGRSYKNVFSTLGLSHNKFQ